MRALHSLTLNGKFDGRCVSCGITAYAMWVDDTLPLAGCPHGHDARIADCEHVQARVQSHCLSVGVLNKPLRDDARELMRRIGDDLLPMVHAMTRDNRLPPDFRLPADAIAEEGEQ